MKVVEGGFGKSEKSEKTFKEILEDCIELSDFADAKGVRFVLIAESEDRQTFLTNHDGPGEVVWSMDLVKNYMMNGGS